ncbi:hypothetical protein AA0Y32_06000 [Georgenia phoenicis]|uniref:hypothetical protein n=1 Tax=unclassified Georgenia TaxID=2626815 RepID=UPI0039AFABD2
MSTTDQTAPMHFPLIPLPVDETYSGHEAPEGFVSTYGWCAWFCAVDIGLSNRGTSISDHGVWCEQRVGKTFQGLRADGTPESVGVDVVQPYLHGVYKKADAYANHVAREQYVRVTLGAWEDDDEQRHEAYLAPSEVRSLARALLHAADSLENVAQPLRRKSER